MSDERVAVCFVCLGNICRSPTAEGVFRHVVDKAGMSDEVLIDSAGTAAYHEGEQADRRSRSAARRRGYDLTSIARQFASDDFQRFDYVLAMDEDNLENLRRLRQNASQVRTDVFGLFRDFDPTAAPHSSVPDPYYGGGQGFEEVLDQCERACEGLIAHIRSRRGK